MKKIKNKKITIFGISVDCYNLEETVTEIIKRIKNNEIIEHVGINSNKIILTERDSKIKKIIQNADMVSIDGYSIVYAIKFLKREVVKRVTGVDTMELLLTEAEREGMTVYFLGAKKESLADMIVNLKTRFPQLKIVGYRDGYFNEKSAIKVVKEIGKLGPNMVFVGITSPYKEVFINKYRLEFKANLIMGVGGSFDIFSGHIKRAPQWMQNSGLEWFYRFIKEPKRLFKRCFYENVVFCIYLLKEKVREL